MPTVYCEVCSKPFSVKPSKIAAGYGRFCSKQCYNQYQTRPRPERRTRIQRTCLTCGADFEVAPNVVANGQGKYCSRSCKYVGDLGPKRPFTERFWSKVNRTSGCWLWTAAVNKGGYGKFGQGPKGGRTLPAHRVAWELTHGPIPEGLCVLHKCDNPPCVNPDHLCLGTLSDNSRDMVAKRRNPVLTDPGRHARGSRDGQAKLTENAVQRIRALYAEGGITQAELASLFQISHTSVWLILNRRSWKHVI